MNEKIYEISMSDACNEGDIIYAYDLNACVDIMRKSGYFGKFMLLEKIDSYSSFKIINIEIK
ncbi:MAG: hypothetical protein RR359_05880 [Bacilli bacterium]